MVHAAVLLLLLPSTVFAQVDGVPGAPKTYVVPSNFPSSIFASYYYGASPTINPQPAIHDPVLDITYPLNLTDPNTIPQVDTDPVFLPTAIGAISPAQATAYVSSAFQQITELRTSGEFTSNCSACVAILNVFQGIAKVAPGLTADTLVEYCVSAGLGSQFTCEQDFGLTNLGSAWVQVLSLADVSGLDGRYICWSLGQCSEPPVFPVTKAVFPKPKPSNAVAPKASGKRVKVLHLSDFHLDARYAVGSEADCSGGVLCCRLNANNSASTPGQIISPAPLYGSYLCDTPYWLAAATMQAVFPLTGTDKDSDSLAWTIYTGDLTSHDNINELSRALEEYSATSIYHMFHQFLKGPVFAALGNHDTNPTAQDAPHILPGNLSTQFSWNYDHISALWVKDGWINNAAAQQARSHYGAYSIINQYGLRIISINTDFWYVANIFNNYNTSNPDVSGTFAWLIDELQLAEDQGEAVWIIGHVVPGFGGTNAYPNPTDYFYQIVDRYSPHVIRNSFFGHSHKDEQMIYYANNGTNRNNSLGRQDALVPGWIGPSVTPLTDLNSGFRMYEVDTGSFDVYEAYTWITDVSTFQDLDASKEGPTFQLEYSTRGTYGTAAGWPVDAPLNGTFWHAVTETMAAQVAKDGVSPLVMDFNNYIYKSSIKGGVCNTTACQQELICYIRSGSVALGLECAL